MSTRIKAAERDAIVDAVMEKTFGARLVALEKARMAMVDAVYNTVVPPEEQERMKTLPAMYLVHEYRLTLVISRPNKSTVHEEVEFYPEGATKTEERNPHKRAFPGGIFDWNNRIYTKDVTAPGIQALDAWNKSSAKLEKEMADFKREVAGIVKGATTFAKLRENWPELVQIVGEELLTPPAPKEYLPAVTTADISSRIFDAMEKAENAPA